MPVTGNYRYPHIEVNIIDNSAITRPQAAITDGVRELFVIDSPRGVDGVLTQITTGVDEFVARFGMGDLNTYGQAILNAYNAFSTGLVTGEVLRIAAPNAKRANLYVYAAYAMMDDEGKPIIPPPEPMDEETAKVPEMTYQLSGITKKVQDFMEDGGYIDLNGHVHATLKYVENWDELFKGDQASGNYFVFHLGDEYKGKWIFVTNEQGKTFKAQDQDWIILVNRGASQTSKVEWSNTEDGSEKTEIMTLYYDTTVCTPKAAPVMLRSRKIATLASAAPTAMKPVVTETGKAKMHVRFLTAYDDSLIYADDLGKKADRLKPTAPEGWTVVYLFSVASLGRGTYSNNLGVRIASNARADRENAYKNYYVQVYEQDAQIEQMTMSFFDNALVTSSNSSITTLYAESVINDPENGSTNIRIAMNPLGFSELVEYYTVNVLDPVLADDAAIEAYAEDIGLTNMKDTTKGAPDPWVALKKCMTLTDQDFDIFLGVNKNLITKVTSGASSSSSEGSAIYNYVVDTVVDTEVETDWTGIQLANVNELTGMELEGGDDGDFAVQYDEDGNVIWDEKKVKEAKDKAYLWAFNPESVPSEIQEKVDSRELMVSVDTGIYSKTQHPLDLILDANYNGGDVLNTEGYTTNIKAAIAALATRRGDCFALLDLGTGIVSKNDLFTRLSAYNLDRSATDRLQSVDGWQMQIRDPSSRKIVTVTPTYWMAAAYATSFIQNNGKHIPLAGGAYGTIELPEMIRGSIFPVFDEAIDSVMMSQLCDYRINYAQINPRGTIIRATQTTRQEAETALSEINNMLIVLDIKRDCESLCTRYSYNFLESTDLARFNRDAEQLLNKYAEAQVRSISATFSSTAEEQDQGILHLEIELAHKRLVKTAVVDIHINRN